MRDTIKEQPFIPGEYDEEERLCLIQQDMILSPIYNRQNITTAATVPQSSVDMVGYNSTGGADFIEMKFRDPVYNDDSSTTMLEVKKMDFFEMADDYGFGCLLYNMYKGTDEMHFFHINAIRHLIPTFEKKYMPIRWKNSTESGVKYEWRYFIPNRLAYKVKAGRIVRYPEDNVGVPPPKEFIVDLSKKITKHFWDEQ